MSEKPCLCELNVGSLAKVADLRVCVINPAQGLVVPLADPTLKFLSPKAEVSHYGKADGGYIKWKEYGSESEAETTQIESPAHTWLPSDRAGGSVAA